MHNTYDLSKTSTNIFIGKVTKVSEIDESDIVDSIDQKLSPMEIIFEIPGIVENARALPLDIHNKVKIGDPILLFSLENIFSNTYYYHTIRYISETNGNIYMTYNGSEVILIPKGNSKSDLVVAGGKSIIHLDPVTQRIYIESSSGGIHMNSHEGFMSIKNDNASLKKILNDLIMDLISMSVITPRGLGSMAPSTAAKLQQTLIDVNSLFQDVDSSSKYPHLPEDTFTPEFAARLVLETGLDALDDDNIDGPPDPKIEKLKEDLQSTGNIPPQPSTSGGPLYISPVTAGGATTTTTDDVEIGTDDEGNIKLSDNYYVKHLTVKTLFPHRLKAQRGLTKDQIVSNLKALAINVLEPLRAQYSGMRVNSGFRGKPSIVGRVSQHELGQAVDLQWPGKTAPEYMEIAEWVAQNLPFDQLIYEHGNSIWLHISFSRTNMRKKMLTMKDHHYENGLNRYYP